MTPETMTPPPEGQTATGLVSGILQDAQELFKQQVALARAEITADFQRGTRAAALLVVGVLALVPAVLLLCHMFVYLLHEQGGLSRWTSFGIVGGSVALLGAVLVAVGVQRLRSINPMPNQTVEEIKENVRWMTNQK
jgi:hypothetical protein